MSSGAGAAGYLSVQAVLASNTGNNRSGTGARESGRAGGAGSGTGCAEGAWRARNGRVGGVVTVATSGTGGAYGGRCRGVAAEGAGGPRVVGTIGAVEACRARSAYTRAGQGVGTEGAGVKTVVGASTGPVSRGGGASVTGNTLNASKGRPNGGVEAGGASHLGDGVLGRALIARGAGLAGDVVGGSSTCSTGRARCVSRGILTIGTHSAGDTVGTGDGSRATLDARLTLSTSVAIGAKNAGSRSGTASETVGAGAGTAGVGEGPISGAVEIGRTRHTPSAAADHVCTSGTTVAIARLSLGKESRLGDEHGNNNKHLSETHFCVVIPKA